MHSIYVQNETCRTINVFLTGPDGRGTGVVGLRPNDSFRFTRLSNCRYAIAAFDHHSGRLLHLGSARPSLAAYMITVNQQLAEDEGDAIEADTAQTVGHQVFTVA